MKTSVSSLVYHAKVAAAVAVIVIGSAVLSMAQGLDTGLHTITGVKFYPEGPATLTNEQYVRLRFSYSTTHSEGVRIWARPMTAGLPTLFYASSGSAILTARDGEHEQSFTITRGEAMVDQIRIDIYTADGKTLLHQTLLPVHYQFQAKPKTLTSRQDLNVKKTDAPQRDMKANGMSDGKLRDFPFPSGVDLQFIIKELARDTDLNVIFDSESFRTPGRKVAIDLRNVTASEAINYILMQEKLVSEKVGPNTILVASIYKVTSIPMIGIGLTSLTEQLADHFGVEGGALINHVRADSPALKAGLKAGDVVVGINDQSVKSPLELVRAFNDKRESDLILKIVRDRKAQTVNLTPNKAFQ